VISIAFTRNKKYALAVRIYGALGEISERPSVFGAVNATQSKLARAVVSLTAGIWPEVDTKDLGRLMAGREGTTT